MMSRRLCRPRSLLWSLYGVTLLSLLWSNGSCLELFSKRLLSRPAYYYDFDLVVIGAGASGLFAAGTAATLGCKTLLVDNHPDSVVGGDCTNAACVPSKAVRSVARMARAGRDYSASSWFRVARQHADNTVQAVRDREDPAAYEARNSNLKLLFVENCSFVSPHELQVLPRDRPSSNGTSLVTGKRFLIATGASPVVPQQLKEEADAANVPVFTYRSVLQPQSDSSTTTSIWNMLEDEARVRPIHLIIAGGGPTACELGQSIARLSADYTNLNITIVAPKVLPSEDMALQKAAVQLLQHEGIQLCLNRRVEHVIPGQALGKASVELDDGELLPVDILLLCLGRSPETSLRNLKLEAAGIAWSHKDGVLVNRNTLRSKTAKHVYACGDCCSAVIQSKQRRAAHAGWTGFHVARNVVVPPWLRIGSRSIHRNVPGVIYTDPELASVGLSYAQCVRKYGKNGFDCLNVPEEGTDRADMERLERPMIGFVELRATKIQGRILGMTACGPAAAELANEVGLAITSGLTVRDVARAIHSYPSHGYLLHRIALAMTTGNGLGLLSALGPLGRGVAACGRLVSRFTVLRPANVLPWKRKAAAKIRHWEAKGAIESVVLTSEDGSPKLLSYLDVQQNDTLRDKVLNCSEDDFLLSKEDRDGLCEWLKS